MIPTTKYARRAARWLVDSVMGNGLAQRENEASEEGSANAETASLARQAAAEGCVLLTNDGTLPLSSEDEIAVFGRCQLDWFFMGHGSGGDVNATHTVNLIEGLQAAGIRYNRVLAKVYSEWCSTEENAADPGWWGHWPTHHSEMPVDAELAEAAAQTARTAVVVLGRTAGEDVDLPLTPGGYYLTDEERSLLDVVGTAFEHTVVVLNVGNLIDLLWTEELSDKISAVLVAWQGGMEAGSAVADVLFGKTNPSGRLAATAARSYEDYPSSATFGNKHHVDYSEDIYVGYRHFDTHAPQQVLFPFGHGLSYTRFEEEIVSVELYGNVVGTRIRVSNVGACPGRNAVPLWCEPPKGSIPKPSRTLAAFGKTEVLAPGESAQLDLVCDLKTLCSYDQEICAFVLEEGDYQFDCTDAASGIRIEERRIVEQCTSLCQSSDELRERILQNLPDELGAQTEETQGRRISFDDVREGTKTLDALVANLSQAELEALTCGEGLMNSKLGAPGNAGAFGGVTSGLRERGIPAAICVDGPSGGRLQRTCSLLPCATALACTWDQDLVRRLYGSVAKELRASNVDVLLAPGMNIQRNPRCGRNFEYFSEDPLVSGKMAAAVVRGLQDGGVSSCPKHFACNNQEMRRNTSDSRVSERALREVYLRGFEICVREASPDLIMTSYNKVNGVWAHYHYDLATTVLRNEWGFEGVVITDWWMRPARSPEFSKLHDNGYRLRAGVDVLMPGSMSHVLQVRSKPDGITHAELQRTARRVLTFLLSRH